MGRSYRVSAQGFAKAQEAFTRKGWTQEYLAGAANCSRQTVINFFAKRAIDKTYFQNICDELGLKWGDVADFELETDTSPSMSAAQENTSENIKKPTVTAPVLTNEKRVAYAIVGTVNPDNVAKVKAIVALLQDLSEDTSIKLIDIERGSIKLILEGSQEGLERIETLFKSGRLKDVLGVSVEDVEFLSVKNSNSDKNRLAFTIAGDVAEGEIAKLKAALTETSDDENSEEIYNISTSILPETNLSRPARSRRYLTSAVVLQETTADVSSQALHFLEQSPAQRLQILQELGLGRFKFLAKIRLNDENIDCVIRFLENPGQMKFPNLSGADLSKLNLDEVSLIRGNLSEANLQGSSLLNADLIFVNFTKADLRKADLRGATLNGTIWLDTLVDECNLGIGNGLTKQQRKDLQLRGAKLNYLADD